MSIGKFRPTEERFVGQPVTELDEADSKALEESQKNPEPVKEEPKKVEAPERKKKSAEANIAVNLRLAPSLNSKVLNVLYPGEKVSVVDYNDDWYKLNYKGTECYVRKEYVTTK